MAFSDEYQLEDCQMTDKNDQNDAVEAADGELQGEGNYKAAAEYRNAQKSFAADKDKVEAKAFRNLLCQHGLPCSRLTFYQ